MSKSKFNAKKFQNKSPGKRNFKTKNVKSNFGYNRAQVLPDKWKHDMYSANGPSSNMNLASGPGKLFISNLDFGVSDNDIQELYGDFGPLIRASVHYDRTGRSLGTADILYENKFDAIRAMKKYNNVPLDGKPMNIQLASSVVPALNRNQNVKRVGLFRGDAQQRSSNSNRVGQFRNNRRSFRGGRRSNEVSKDALDTQLTQYSSSMEIE